MKDYKKLFKIGTVITGLGFFSMTMMFFVLIVYAKDFKVSEILEADRAALKISLFPELQPWPWLIGFVVLYAIGIPLIIRATNLKQIERIDSLKIK